MIMWLIDESSDMNFFGGILLFPLRQQPFSKKMYLSPESVQIQSAILRVGFTCSPKPLKCKGRKGATKTYFTHYSCVVINLV